MSVSSIHAQLYSVPSCSTLGSTLYGPMYSAASANATNRYAVIYPASQLSGIAGQIVSGMYFNRSTATGSMAGTPNFKIYVKEIAAIDFGEGALDWATATVGTTLVYDSNPATIVGDSAGWKLFPLATNFTYSGTQNLAVFFEYTNSTASASISWFYEYLVACIDTGNSNTSKYTNNTTGTLPTSLTSSNFRRPFIGFDYLVSCNAPNSVIASDVTTTTATISWVPFATAPSEGHEYFLSTSDTPPAPTDTPTGTIPTGSTLNLTDLIPNTQYYIWVRANCGVVDGVSALASGSFRTGCIDVTEFTEVFEGLPTGASTPMPPCWAKAGTGAVYVTTGSVAPMSGPNRLYMTASGTTPTESYAILPSVSNLQANTHRLRFKAYSTSGTDRTMEIGYVTNPEDIATYVYLQDINLPGTAAASAQEFIIYPGALPAGVKNLVFKNPGHPGGVNTLYIDDVIWQQSPSCLEVSNVTTTLITENSAQINWTNVGTETAWDIEYGVPGFTLGDGTMISGITTNPYVLTNLTSNTNYQYYIRASCSVSDQSAWMGPYDFKTLCSTVTDYIVTFEGLPTGTGNLPDCWSKLGTSNNVYTTTASVAPMSPPNRLYMNISTTTTAYALMTPVSNLQANTHKLRFKVYATSANKILQVGYFTDPTDVSTFVSLEDYQMPSTTAATAQEFQLIPTTVPAGVTQLAFGLVSGSTTTVYIDDVIWEVNSTCQQPTSLNASDITFESAILNWANGGDETIWDIEYGVQGFQLGTGTQILGTNSNPYSLTGLIPATNYQYYVRAICTGNIPSAWSGPFAFKTACTDFDVYSTDFSGLATGTAAPMPDCWSKLGNGSVYPTTGSVAPMSPTIRLYMFSSSTATPTTEGYAVLPAFSNLSANTHRLRFKGYATLAGRFLEFGYFTDPSDISTFVYLQEINLPGTVAASALEFVISPGALPAGVKHLALKNPGFPGGSSTVYLDDFIWEPIPSCLEPSNLFASQLAQTSVSLSWNASGSNETVWDIEYGAPGFTPGDGTLISGVTTNPYTLGGLTENTSYEFYVRAVCGVSDSSVWIGPHAFKTLCSPVTEYTMNFEGQTTGVGNLPDCWSRAGSSNNVYTATSSVAPMSPPNRLYMNSATTTEAYAVLPPFSNIQANTHRLKFKAYATSVNKVLQVGYFTNTPDVNTFVAIDDIQLPSTAASTALEFVVVPNNVPVGVSQLVLKLVQTTTATTAYMDDFVWEPIPTVVPSCATNIVAVPDAACGNFATQITWTAAADADAYRMTMGTTPGGTDVLDNVNVGPVTTYSHIGNPNTTYYYTITPYNTFAPAVGCVEQSFTTAVNPCACTPVYTTGVGSNDMMSNVVIIGTTLSNNTGNSTTAPSYNYYSGQPNYTATLVEATNYNMDVTVGSGGAQGVSVWIDFNDNLTFEESEKVGFTTTNIAASTTGTIQLVIPCNANPGLHRMRVRNVYNTAGNTIDPCSSYTWGEAEDYDITIAEIAIPTGDAIQTVNVPTASDATIQNLVVAGSGIKWFASEADALANVNELPVGTIITDGTTYYAVSSVGTCNSEALAVTVVVTLGVNGFDSSNFKYYPNPVTNSLTISYTYSISEVVVSNLLGQQISAVKPNVTQTDIDMSSLPNGTYLVKVTSDNQSKTIKVIKQ
ncbi:T9SS C-terminal target domain-containing protein [Flavobacterium orientale]|uniref:T9SS C-terminal target domain-containing protein n=2 Tax=Flavobacterium orientale TaxID=1756020 RepID=A0A916XWJ5_9FLAO|nr:T9SS C-terminal target domain-containing protein [Flavobacterium orientale]